MNSERSNDPKETSEDVTVVIPTHNRFETLRRALESVASQSHAPIAVIVVDDVGEVRVREMVSRFGGLLAAQYVDGSSRATKSAGASRNEGAAMASSQWLAFLDDDDYWRPDYLETALADLSKRPTDMWACNVFIEHEGRVIRDWQQPEVTWDRRGLPNGGVSGSNLVIARSAFEQVNGYDAELPVWNDLDLELRLRLAGASITISKRNLVGADADGADHLTSASLKRANGLATWMRKNGDHMSWRDHRNLRAAMHSSYAHFADSPWGRLKHRILQAANTRPADLVRQALSRESGPFA